MNLQSLQRQLVRDLKASWQKTAVLAILLGVGLIFWIPPLVRAFSGGNSNGGPAAAPAAVPTPASAAATPAAAQPTGFAAEKSTRPVNSWQRAGELLRSDPLVRSVEVAAIQSNPFHVDHDQFPPPILFAEEPAETETDKKQTKAADVEGPRTPEGLVLKSTIVGVQRRAAYINSKLYFEGTEVRAGGEAYRLAAVFPRKVVLKRGDETFELKITPQPTSGNAELNQGN